MGSSPKQPPAPDYTGAAQATGASNLENTRLQAELNRADVNTPLGSQTWTMTGPDQYRQDINLSPEQQKLFEQQQATQQMMSATGQQQLTGAQDMLSKPFDINAVGGGQQEIQDALYRRSTSMLDPQFQQREDAERTRLANQGFQTGTEGFDKAMGNFNRDREMSYGDARDRAIVGGQDARKQAVSEALIARNQPLNEINSLMTGSQVQMPTFQSTPAVPTAPGTDYGTAAAQQGQYDMGLYNTAVGSQNATKSAIGTMAGAGLGAYATYAGMAAF